MSRSPASSTKRFPWKLFEPGGLSTLKFGSSPAFEPGPRHSRGPGGAWQLRNRHLSHAGRYGGLAPKDPFGNTKAGFRATGKPNRKGYGLVWSKALDSGGVAGGDEVDWVANLERIKK